MSPFGTSSLSSIATESSSDISPGPGGPRNTVLSGTFSTRTCGGSGVTTGPAAL